MLERDLLLVLSYDHRVKSMLEQPFTLRYQLDGRERRYTPDVQADFAAAGREWSVVYEVKERHDLAENWQSYRPRFKAAVAYCRERGWRFKLMTEKEIRGPQVANIRFLRRYLDVPVQELHHVLLKRNLLITGPTTPQALLALSWSDQERKMAALCELWRMVANNEICTNLTAPLTMSSLIWSAD